MKNRVLLAFMYNTINFLSNAKQNIHIHYEAHSLHILTILYYMYKHTVLELFYAFIKLSYQITAFITFIPYFFLPQQMPLSFIQSFFHIRKYKMNKISELLLLCAKCGF